MKAVVTALLLASCAPAHAEITQCGAYDAVVAGLGERYGENRRMAGLMGPSEMLEVYANDETGTWTVITVTPDGQACLRAAGDTFSDTPSELPGQL